MGLSLRSKISCLSALILITLLISCGNNTAEKEKTSEKKDSGTCAVPIVGNNPNGSSELSQLMRKMQSSVQSLKEMIEKGELPAKFPEEFLKIHTAQPTDSETKKESFNAFADAYLQNLKTLYSSSKEDIKGNYNAVINACESCHGEHCPGPLRAIRKLKLQ